MLERSFIEALQADPNDEVSRLVYADWLDEQGDFRGELLRAEMAYFRGEEALLRVSELAARAAPAWLCGVTLMARQVEAVWAVTSRAFSQVGGEEPTDWSEAEDAIGRAFDALREPRRGDFVVPYDYALFQHLFPGGWYRPDVCGPGDDVALWASVMVQEQTATWYDQEEIMAEVDVGSDDLWLSIVSPGAWHEELFLNCSRTATEFGRVVMADDRTHPAWVVPHPVAVSYVEYLRRLAL